MTKPKCVISVIAIISVLCSASIIAQSNTEPVLGIDVGAKHVYGGIHMDGVVQIIPNDRGNRYLPAFVSFAADGSQMIGEEAKDQAMINPTRTVFDVKRLIGQNYEGESVQTAIKHLPYQVLNSGGNPSIQIEIEGVNQTWSPEDVYTLLLRQQKASAEALLRRNVSDAVLTVPVYFTDNQRLATKSAAEKAGLHVIRIINEPIAAAIAYGLDKLPGVSKVLVFDLGAGSFDATVLDVDDGVMEILANEKHPYLGGDMFDQRLLLYLSDLMTKKHGVDVIMGDRVSQQKLTKAVERAKRILSSYNRAVIEIESLVDGLDLTETVSRDQFEQLNSDLFRMTLELVKQALSSAQVSEEEIDEVVLVGGSSRIPKIQELLQQLFVGKSLRFQINPDEVVAYGATVLGHHLVNSDPADQMLTFDLCLLSLGVETTGGLMTPVIYRNTILPTRKSLICLTSQDDQESVQINIYEGQRAMATDNRLVGSFGLTGISRAPRGHVQIEVTFEVDVVGMLHVSARELNSSNQATIRIVLPQVAHEELERLCIEADALAEDDTYRVERIGFQNVLDEEYLCGCHAPLQ